MIPVPQKSQALYDDIARTAKIQLNTSRQFQYPRLKEIAEGEDLYYGQVKKSIKNPFNRSFPFVSGFVDTLMSGLDDPPAVEFEPNDEADYNSARKYQALLDQEMQSTLPNAQWALKDRHCKKFAIFSGYGVYCLYADSYEGNFTMYLDVVDYYDFHYEPDGGGNLEEHIFTGRDNVYKTQEDIESGMRDGRYDVDQVTNLIAFSSASDYKSNTDDQLVRFNRYRAMGLDPLTHNYTGQNLYKFAEWYLTYLGVRWYCLFDTRTGYWIKIQPLREMFKPVPTTGEALWPFVAWHTHEDGRMFSSKAPVDDARPIGVTINTLINQELYNREKKNTGKMAYDPDMYTDLEALAEWRPDGLVPFDSKGGTRTASQGLYKFDVGDISGTINLVGFLDSFSGQKTGTTPGSQGQAPSNQQATVFLGELKQVQGRLSLYNKSYKEAWAQLAYRAILLFDEHITKPIAIKMMGSDGICWDEITPEDSRRVRDYGIKIKGGNDDLVETNQKNARKQAALAQATTVDPKWKDKEALKAAGYSEEELREAWSTNGEGSKELMSDAAMAVDIISNGRIPKLNINANVAWAQKLFDEADEVDDAKIQGKIYDFIKQHAMIIARNEARDLKDLLAVNARNGLMAGVSAGAAPAVVPGGELPGSPTPNNMPPGASQPAPGAPSIPSPTGGAAPGVQAAMTRIGNRIPSTPGQESMPVM